MRRSCGRPVPLPHGIYLHSGQGERMDATLPASILAPVCWGVYSSFWMEGIKFLAVLGGGLNWDLRPVRAFMKLLKGSCRKNCYNGIHQTA